MHERAVTFSAGAVNEYANSEMVIVQLLTGNHERMLMKASELSNVAFSKCYIRLCSLYIRLFHSKA